jgi:hypothetical protein
MMNYNMAASRTLVAALGELFGADKFDEYTILSHARELPVGVFCPLAALGRLSEYRLFGARPDYSTWFKVLPGLQGHRGGRRARFNSN